MPLKTRALLQWSEIVVIGGSRVLIVDVGVDELHGLDEDHALAGILPRPRRFKGQRSFGSRRFKDQRSNMPGLAALAAGDAPAVGAAVEEDAGARVIPSKQAWRPTQMKEAAN